MLDDKYLFKKSDNTNQNFDTILVSRRDIEIARIPSYIKYISNFAFESCKKLKSVEFEQNSSVEIIGSYAFCKNMLLTRIELPESVKKIKNNCFDGCNALTNIEILGKSIQIDGYCFLSSKKPKSIIFPKATDISFDKRVLFKAENIKFYIKQDAKLIGEGVESIQDSIIYIEENQSQNQNKNLLDISKNDTENISKSIQHDTANTKHKNEKEEENIEIRSLKQENESLHQKTNDLEKQISQLKEKVNQLEDENRQKTVKNKLLESYLFALKEKQSTICFFDLSDYEVETTIGKGVTSSVKIVHKTKKEKYAQKILKNFTIESIKRFLAECEILFLLRHPCIIRVYGFNNGDEKREPSMILSLEPFSLEQAIQDEILDNHQKNRITVEVVLGMRYIHKRNFMHRDLKPSNILLSEKKHVRISDFGLAKEEDLETSQSRGVGTLRFMAPEIFEVNEDDEIEDGEGKNKQITRYTNKVDVYSFGITLIYIVTDKYPAFNMRNVINGVAPKLNGKIVEWVRELIIRCLSYSPENRPSFAEIFELLKSHDYDMFSDTKNGKLTTNQQTLKKEIEHRILKIEAFEFQHQDE